MTTDTSEKGLERLICMALTGHPCDLPSISSGPSTSSGIPGDARDGCGWIGGSPGDYEREYCVDLAQLAAFLQVTQPKAAEVLDLGGDSPIRRKFLARLQGEISKRGTIDVLRHGVKDGAHQIDLFYGTPRPETTRPGRSTTPTASR
jgi:type I restriction enzyme R subunit